MTDVSRRRFIRQGALGLAVAGVGTYMLRANVGATPPSGSMADYHGPLYEPPQPVAGASGKWAATEDNILGPYFRPGAPYRAKITPPLEPGTVLLVQGRVWALDTRKPLAGALLDIWQANAQGRYDNDDPSKPPAPRVFSNRARLLTDETGYYEFETVHPGPYQLDENAWRPSHIHYRVHHPGYRELITQLYFKGDPHQTTDPYIKPSLIITLAAAKAGDQPYKKGVFDIVLAPNAQA